MVRNSRWITNNKRPIIPIIANIREELLVTVRAWFPSVSHAKSHTKQSIDDRNTQKNQTMKMTAC